MNIFRLIIKSLKHYRASNFAASVGIAITTAVICGALIIGDSLNYSLFEIIDHRLGKTTHTITAGERIFTQDIALKLNLNEKINAQPVLHTTGITTQQESGMRVNNVKIWGVNDNFGSFYNSKQKFYDIPFGEAVINSNLAGKLEAEEGDFILLSIRNTGVIPSNTPFVAEENQIISRRIKITGIVENENGGNFNLQASQISPYNIFVNIEWLNRVLGLENSANIIITEVDNSGSSELLTEELDKSWSLKDLNLEIKVCDKTNNYFLTSERVFIDKYISNQIISNIPETESYLSYFVNRFTYADNTCPYSFVAASDSKRFNIKNNEIIINKWLADDLQVSVGDSIILDYYKIGLLRELEENQQKFVVSGIISMEESVSDKNIMPFIPGLSDAGNCRDWNAGVPIDLKTIRQKDEDYWEVYKGTPKAYISLKKGQDLWENRFGNLSTIVIQSEAYNENDIYDILTNNIDPFRLEFRINEVRKYGETAAMNGEDFSSLFAGLGVFIIFSGLLLTVLIFNLSLKKRRFQIKLYDSLGFSKKIIRKIIIGEFAFIAFFGALSGMLLSIFYSKLIMSGINQVWFDIVRTDSLNLYFSYSSIITGGVAGILLSLVATYIGINKAIQVENQVDKIAKQKSKKNQSILKYFSGLLFIISVSLIVYLVISGEYEKIFLWFFAGVIFLISVLLVTAKYFYSDHSVPSGNFSVFRLSLRNLTRNPARSISIIVLLALGSFIIITTAVNRKEISGDYSSRSSGTGGFDYFAETTVPILSNLNDTDSRYSFPYNINFVQFFSVYDDDASCLNLNQVANPRILAVNPELLVNRFSFAGLHRDIDSENPWMCLNKDLGGIIPAIADQTVIRWGLGKSVGDTLVYHNSSGEEILLLLIGGLENSVFQGNVIISESNFRKHFPALSGTNVFLIDVDKKNTEIIEEELSFIFRDYGIEVIPANIRLSEFNSVENTYLQIFFMLGALGIMLGTIGLAIVLGKSLIERNSEIALLSSMGFSYRKISLIYINEYAILLLVGIFTGSLSAVISAMPAFIESPISTIGYITGVNFVLIINGIFWILLITMILIRKLSIPTALRNE